MDDKRFFVGRVGIRFNRLIASNGLQLTLYVSVREPSCDLTARVSSVRGVLTIPTSNQVFDVDCSSGSMFSAFKSSCGEISRVALWGLSLARG